MPHPNTWCNAYVACQGDRFKKESPQGADESNSFTVHDVETMSPPQTSSVLQLHTQPASTPVQQRIRPQQGVERDIVRIIVNIPPMVLMPAQILDQGNWLVQFGHRFPEVFSVYFDPKDGTCIAIFAPTGNEPGSNHHVSLLFGNQAVSIPQPHLNHFTYEDDMESFQHSNVQVFEEDLSRFFVDGVPPKFNDVSFEPVAQELHTGQYAYQFLALFKICFQSRHDEIDDAGLAIIQTGKIFLNKRDVFGRSILFYIDAKRDANKVYNDLYLVLIELGYDANLRDNFGITSAEWKQYAVSALPQQPRKSLFVSAAFPPIPHIYPPKHVFVLHAETKKWLHVRTKTGNIKTIRDLKEFAQKELQILAPFKITHGGVTLDNDSEHFDRFLIHDRPWLIPTPSNYMGITRSLNFSFTDMHHMQEIEITGNEPAWRKVKRGLCIEGRCTNSQCQAYFPRTNSLVIMPMGYGEFDFMYDAHRCKCPLCGDGVAPVTCALNNCKWKYTGTKAKQPEKPEESDWEEVGNVYAKFSDSEQDQTEWVRLVIQTEKIGFYTASICDLCTEDFSHGTKKKTKCGHVFHGYCLSEWKNENPIPRCPNCRAVL
jgi:hypothetical protein